MICPKEKVEICEYFNIKVNPGFCARCVKSRPEHREKLKAVIEKAEAYKKAIIDLKNAQIKESQNKEEKKSLTPEVIIADYRRVLSGLVQAGKQGELISEEEYIRRRQICIACYGGYRCPHYCCGIQTKLALVNWVCRKKKF